MCAEINPVKPAGEKYKLQVLPAETLARVAVANLACQTATLDMKPGNAIVQAVMRKREGSRAPLNSSVRGGRASIVQVQGNTEELPLQASFRHHRGPRPQHVQKVRRGNSGASLESQKRNSKVRWQGLTTKSNTTLSREFRCFHSSGEVR
jgi:hypothetical protein